MATTHMGQSPADHVTLEVVGGMSGGCGPAQLDFVRILSDGTQESGPGGLGWRVPKGHVLVVTDVDWQYVHPDRGAAAGRIEVLRLFVQGLSEPSTGSRVFESTVALSAAGEGLCV